MREIKARNTYCMESMQLGAMARVAAMVTKALLVLWFRAKSLYRKWLLQRETLWPGTLALAQNLQTFRPVPQ